MASIVVPTRGTVDPIDFPWLEATAEEAIEVVRSLLEEPCQGTMLLSCGVEKLEPSKQLLQCGSTQFTLANFTHLVPAKSAELKIPTELRGITIGQLSDLVAFIRDLAPFWYEAHASSAHWGQALTAEVFNLYHASFWVIMPSTSGAHGGHGCSYVERIATQADEQRPSWFVSHAWLEPVVDFVACLRKHATLRCLTSQTAYWICAYANNQHDLESEIVANPRKTSFYKAMSLCIGVVLILDSDATPFQRIWCCFEESIVVSERDAGTSRLLLDVAATDEFKEAHVITDGFAEQEQCLMPLLGFFAKSTREANFPTRILRKGLDVNIADATAFAEQDKRAILTSIALPRASTKVLFEEACPAAHPNFSAVNRSLASHFALAALFGALVQGEDTSRLLEALAADLDRRVVQLSFTGCRAFRDLEAQMLLQALPRLSVLRLDLGFTAIQKLEFPEMPSLTELVLRFTGSSLRDASGLCAALTPRLQLLHLWFANLPSLQQLGSMSRALAALRVEELVLHLSGCPNIPPETKQQMYDAAQRLRRLRWQRLDAWIHIEGAERSERPWRGKLAQENFGEPAFPSPRSKTSSPVLQSTGRCRLQGAALEDALPFPCSHPGCAAFHGNLQGFCQQHRLRGRARAVVSRCHTAWRWLELMLLFFAQAAAEMESRAALLAMLLSMYAVAVWPVIRSFSDSNSPSSADCFVAALSAAALGSLAWTWRQFDRLQRVARQVALSTEASYSAVLEAKRAGEAEEEAAVRLLGPSTLTEADEGLESYGSVPPQQASADLSHLYCEARRHLPHLESMVHAALADLPAPVAPAKIRLLTELSSEERQRPQGLVDLLSCEVNCKDMPQVQAALAALKAWLEREESCGCFQLVALHDGFATLSSRKCCQVVVSHQGYLASIFLLDASLARLQADMTDMYRLADSFGLLDEVKPRTWETSRRLWEPRPPRSVIAVTTFLRVVALLVALFFAVQYFVRYAPARWRKKLPGILLEATFVLDATASDRESWGQAILLSLPYAILVQVFAWELLPATGSKKRAKPTQVIYEKYFGLCGSHYVLKVLVLQFGSVLLQVFGKLRLLGALVTLAQHEAPASAGPFARVFWGLCALLAWNCVYPALLLVLPDVSWLRGGAALMDAVMDLASMLGYLLMVLMALVQLQTAEEVQGNYGIGPDNQPISTLDFSVRVPPGFAFPTGFWGYAAVYVNVAHVCCVCRMLRRSSWAGLNVARVRQSRQKGRKGWRYLGAAAYASCLLLVLTLFLMSKDTYPGHSGNFRCFPCHCAGSGKILRLERCPLAEVLQMEQMSLHGRNITDIAAEALGPLGCQLRRLSLSGNPLLRLPASRFEGLSCLQSLDLCQAQLTELDVDAFRGLAQLKLLTLSDNRLRQIPALLLRPLPALDSLILGGMQGGNWMWIFKGNELSSLPRNLFATSARLKTLDLSHNTLQTLEPDTFRGLSQLRILYLDQNQLQELPPNIFQGLGQLQQLTLHRNQLRELPPNLFQDLGRLQQLLLRWNQLRELPPSVFQGLGELQHLELLENQIRELPPNVFQGLSQLQELMLGQNQLRELPPNVFQGLTRLQALAVSQNQLRELPPNVFQGLSQLQDLMLGQNQLRELPPNVFQGLNHLQGLLLHQNQLGEIPPKVFQGLGQLHLLWLHQNRLRELPPNVFQDLGQLQMLRLSHNQLRELPPNVFADLGQLQRLWLDQNQLRELLAGAFRGLGELQELRLNYNELNELPLELFQDLNQMNLLNLSSNNISHLLPHAIPSRGTVLLRGNPLCRQSSIDVQCEAA